MSRPICLLDVVLLAACVLVPACVPGLPGKPEIILAAPPHGSEFRENDNVVVQSTSTDAIGIARVELLIDGAIVRSDAAPGSATYLASQNWQATAGTHTLAVRAYNTRGTAGDLAAATILVRPAPAPSLAIVNSPAPPATSVPTVTAAPRRPATPSPARPKATMPAQFQDDTLFEGKQDYSCDARGCWRADGTVNNQPDFFYPDLDADNDDIRALLGSIGLPATPAADDREKWQRVRTIWTWLNKNVIREERPNREAAWNLLNALAATPKDHWPSIGDMAQVFKRYNGLVWGACNSRAFALATLLYRVGLAPNDMAVVTAKWKPEYSQHLYVVLRMGGSWYYLDPTCNEAHPSLSASPESVGCNTADYVHPNTINLLPSSSLAKPMLVR